MVDGTARLVLADGSVYRGRAFGATGRGVTAVAEVVFNTAMSGYQESLTDPSYAGQILVQTCPLIGNTGTNAEDGESGRVQVSGFVVREVARRYSNFRAQSDLATLLARDGVLGIEQVDTRAITRRLRVAGVMPGVLTDRQDLGNDELVAMARAAPSMAGCNLVPAVGRASPSTWNGDARLWGAAVPAKQTRLCVAVMDCGVKHNSLRHLAHRGCRVSVVPHDADPDWLRQRRDAGELHGLLVSNGPGDPAAVAATIRTLRRLMDDAPDRALPVFGICLGCQLLALAMGARTYKLKFGHRGVNHPVLNLVTGQVEITSQNHGFAVDTDALRAAGGEPTHVHLNDGTLAGFCRPDRPVLAVQFHPEASPGPHDAAYLFDVFVEMMERGVAATEEVFERGRARWAELCAVR